MFAILCWKLKNWYISLIKCYFYSTLFTFITRYVETWPTVGEVFLEDTGFVYLFIYFLVFLAFFLLFALLNILPFFTLCPPQPRPSSSPSLRWSSHCCLSMSYACMFFSSSLHLLSSSPSFPFPSDSCYSVPCVHASVSHQFVSLFCSLNAAYKWDHFFFTICFSLTSSFHSAK